MPRVPVLAGVCVLTFATALVAQPGPPQSPSRAGGSGEPQTTIREAVQALDPELEYAREELQREMAAGQRIEDQIKVDQKAGNRDGVKRGNALLKVQRGRIKVAQERLRILQARRGRGDGRAGRAGDARGRAGDGRGRGGDGRGRGGDGRGGRGGRI
jgi:hypothetical protein